MKTSIPPFELTFKIIYFLIPINLCQILYFLWRIILIIGGMRIETSYSFPKKKINSKEIVVYFKKGKMIKSFISIIIKKFD